MLMLSRTPGQSIRIGDDIIIHLRSVRGNIVRVGIEAPKSVRILRTEIFEREKHANQQEASREDFSPIPTDNSPRAVG